MDRLFFVLLAMRAQRIYAERGRRRYCHGVPGWQVKSLSQRRDRRCDHALRDIFVIDVRNVVDAKAVFAHRSIEILSTSLQIENLPTRMMLTLFQPAMVFDVLLVIVGVGDLLEVAADYRGRFVMLGYRHCLIAFVASCYENVSSHEVHEVRALEK